jgi:hypothetical protein
MWYFFLLLLYKKTALAASASHALPHKRNAELPGAAAAKQTNPFASNKQQTRALRVPQGGLHLECFAYRKKPGVVLGSWVKVVCCSCVRGQGWS